ncbi:MAG: glycosyltransferase family 39 protein [Reyranella sp.]|uniref:glycosyltransferase family 39 protein n=1 Tax=Reyranella sp. TaxID=1929291 RepID=UPI001AD35E1D|nr:glycosyltransferase family 39 protein [Reyranella sp.]MBN9086380.1 glycosyltransferase family 39 protein [Reyranella sp.]
MVPARQTWTVRADSDRRIAVAGFGLAVAVGLVFAFVGLDTHSLWFDELFTAKLLEPWPGTTLFERIATDVHPPLYLLTLGAFTQVAGASDAMLRLPSALAASAAIVVFVAGMRAVFSLPARLFGAALATGSLFWFSQAQNARSYALCLLIVTGILALALARLRGQRGWRTPALLALMLAGAFTHFYVLHVGLAVLILLGLLEHRDRWRLAAAGAALAVAAGLYVKLVIEPHTRVSLGDNWYRNDVAWYVAVLKSCLDYTLGTPGLVALLLCAAAILHGRRGSTGRLQPSRTLLFLAGVPVVVLLGAIASSTLLAPNFWDRNFMVVSPFVWALAALAYDAAVEKAAPALRLALTVTLAALALSMAGVAVARLPGTGSRVVHEPFRQSAAWIGGQPACRGQVLPVITTDSPAWYKPGYAELIYGGAYGHYLQGFAPTALVFSRDLAQGVLPAGLKAELQRRLASEGCPVLAWMAHNVTPEASAWVRDKLLAIAGSPAGVTTHVFEDGGPGFVLAVKR